MRRIGVAAVGIVLGLGLLWRGGASEPVPEAPVRSALSAPRAPRVAPATGERQAEQQSVEQQAAEQAPVFDLEGVVIEGEEPGPDLDEETILALVQAGERGMDEGDLELATSNFRTVVEEVPDSKLAPFAAYKLAWCEWNAGERGQAMLDMERAASWARESEDEQARMIAEVALGDLERWRVEPKE